MPTKMALAAQEDFADYSRQLAEYQKEKQAIQDQIDILKREYAPVLDYLQIKEEKPARLQKGRARELVLEAVSLAEKPLRAVEIVELLDGQVSPPTVAANLNKLVEQNLISKNHRKEYSIIEQREPEKPKYVLRKSTDKKEDGE